MLVRWPVAALVLVALSAVGCGGNDSSGTAGLTQPIAGDWTGTLKQSGLKPFRIAVRIEATGTGRVAYTGIDCGGTWHTSEVLSSEPPRYEVTEQIDEGAGGECKGRGRVSLQPKTSLRSSPLRYRFTGGGVTSRGVLNRTDPAGLRPVFDEAGVTPP